MLKEGVPPAMIENTARMAGMPVGPLSLSDEVALDLVLKIMKATEADLGPNADRSGAEEAAGRDGREAGSLRPQERQGLLRLSGEGQGQEGAVAGRCPTLQPTAARSGRARCRGAEAALPGGAGGRGRAHGGGSRDHRSARGGRRLDPRASASRPTPAARCPTSTSWARRISSRSATSWKRSTARASRRRSCWKRWPPRARPSTAALRRRRRRLLLTVPRRLCPRNAGEMSLIRFGRTLMASFYAALISPSASIASFTFGRSPTRSK